MSYQYVSQGGGGKHSAAGGVVLHYINTLCSCRQCKQDNASQSAVQQECAMMPDSLALSCMTTWGQTLKPAVSQETEAGNCAVLQHNVP